MNPHNEFLRIQYSLVQSTRDELLKYCSTISNEEFIKYESSFGRGGSIRNLLVHIANVYEFWIGCNALNIDLTFAKYEHYSSLTDIYPLFQGVDESVDEFLQTFKADQIISFELNGIRKKTAALTVFTHVITHEFHHKGQILSLSRHLGYIPIDTDIIRQD